jgi:hypothetical protein
MRGDLTAATITIPGANGDEIEAYYAALAFYGATEQVLTGWIFDLIPHNKEDFETAPSFIVETVFGGLGTPAPDATAARQSD